MNEWTENEERRLADLVANGASAGIAAEALGRSRSGIIGKAKRMGLRWARATGWPRPTPGPRKRIGPAKKGKKKVGKPAAYIPSHVPPKPKPTPRPQDEKDYQLGQEIISPTAVPTPLGAGEAHLALKYRQCRWPHGEPEGADFHFCGAETQPGKRYCPTHEAVSVNPWQPRRL